MRMSYQELYRRWLIDRVVRGIMYLLTGFAAVFLTKPILNILEALV